jgi:PhzF family phenazine biosynthesis protein
MSVPFCLVDVFAEEPLTGNPLAVVADAESLAEEVMRLVAREFNQSETTFVLPPRRDGATWRLRSFTPTGEEVVGAGHNALGAWWWLATAGRVELDREGGAVVAQEIGDRVLPVEVLGRDGEPDAIAMEQAPPDFLGTVADLGELAAALGLERADLAGDAQVVSTGAAHLMVPVRDRGLVERVTVDPPRLRRLSQTWAVRAATSTAWTPSALRRSRTRASSTQLSASGKTPRPAAPPVRSSAGWWPRASRRPARRCSSSRGTRWAGRAASGSTSTATVFVSPAPAW